MFKAIQSLYANVSYAVKVNSNLTSWFDISRGVKQGCKLSPTLFQIYINDLVEDINKLNCGIQINGKTSSVLLFADDIALISRSEADLQRMLSLVDNWCRKWRLSINASRTKIIHFRFKGKTRSQFNFKCGNHTVEYTEEYKYLGLWLNEHLDYNMTVKHISRSSARALGALTAKFYQCGGMSYSVFTKLYESLVVPVSTYASSIWGIKSYKDINAIQIRAAKTFLGLNKTSSNDAAKGDIGWPSTYARQLGEVSRLQARLSNMTNSRITKAIHTFSKGRQKSLEKQISKVFEQYNMSYNYKDINSKPAVKQHVKEVIKKVDNVEQQAWIDRIWDDRKNVLNGNKLRLFRLHKERIMADPYVIQDMPRCYRQSLAKFRCGSLPLLIESGRYQGLTLQERTCKFCAKDQIEDEKHALLECDLYDDLRYDLLKHMRDTEPAFNTMPLLARFCTILSTDTVQFILAKYIYLMFKRRKLHDAF